MIDVIPRIARTIYTAGAKRGFREGYRRGSRKAPRRFTSLKPRAFQPYLDMHKQIQTFSIRVNQVSFNKYNALGPSYRGTNLSRGCFYKLGERAVIFHRSILSLCEDGWASVAPVILRSMMECILYSIVIVEKDSEYRAFLYQANEFLNDLTATSLADEAQKLNSKREIQKALAWLCPQDLQRAESYVQEFLKRREPRTYWYKSIYKNTGAILNRCNKPAQTAGLFKILSMSTHSTAVGSNIFKDEPDKVDINPRSDKRGTVMALAGSSHLLLEISDIRGRFEKLGLEAEANELRQAKAKLKEW